MRRILWDRWIDNQTDRKNERVFNEEFLVGTNLYARCFGVSEGFVDDLKDTRARAKIKLGNKLGNKQGNKKENKQGR